MAADPSELIMGALPFIPQTPQNSINISTGASGASPGAASEMNGTMMAGAARTSSGTAVLVTWFLILFILIACNVFTLRIQR